MQDTISVDELISTWLPDATREIKSLGYKGIVLLDEFDAINDYVETKNADKFYFTLREIRASISHIKLIAVTGRHPDTLIDSAKGLLKDAVKIPITLMSPAEIKELTRLSNNSLNWTTGAIERLWNFTKGHPLLAQSLCSAIWKKFSTDISVNDKPIIRKDDVDDIRFVLTNELGHVADYAWSLLNSQEKFTICYSATILPNQTVVADFLDYLENQALSDSFRNPNLDDILSGLERNDWIELSENKESYIVKIPMYGERIKQTQELSSLKDILFDDRSRRFALLSHASQANDDADAINDYKKSLAISPDDESTKSLLIKRYHSLIKFQLDMGENNLALKQIEDLLQYEKKSRTVQAFEQRARENINEDVTLQRIDWAVRKEDYLDGYRLSGKLRPALGRQGYYNVVQSHLFYIANTWLKALALSSPSIIALLFLGKYAYTTQSNNNIQKYDFVLLATVIGLTFLGSLTKSILSVEIKKLLRNHSFQSVMVNILGIFFLFTRISDVAIFGKLIIALFII